MITWEIIFSAFMETLKKEKKKGLLLTCFPGNSVILLGSMNEGRASAGSRVNQCKPITPFKHAHMWIVVFFLICPVCMVHHETDSYYQCRGFAMQLTSIKRRNWFLWFRVNRA